MNKPRLLSSVILLFFIIITGCTHVPIAKNNISDSQLKEERLLLGNKSFDSQLADFSSWMRKKGYDERIVQTYIDESKNPSKREVLVKFFQMRNSKARVQDALRGEGHAIFRLFDPINITFYDVIPTDSDVEYIAFNQTIASQYAEYLSVRFGKKFNVKYEQVYLDYNATFGDKIFERVLIPKEKYVSRMKSKFGDNLEGMSPKQAEEYDRNLKDVIMVSNRPYVSNPDYFAIIADKMTVNYSAPCIYRLSVTKYHGRDDMFILEVRKCSLIMNMLQPFLEQSSKPYYMSWYFDAITEELGHSFGLVHEKSEVNDEVFEFAGIMADYNMFKSPDGPWVSPLVRYALEPAAGYDDDQSKTTPGFGKKYNQVMAWKLANMTKND